jgi:hypothetical protein
VGWLLMMVDKISYEEGLKRGRMQLYKEIILAFPRTCANKKEANKLNIFFRIWFDIECKMLEKYPELRNINDVISHERLLQEIAEEEKTASSV